MAEILQESLRQTQTEALKQNDINSISDTLAHLGELSGRNITGRIALLNKEPFTTELGMAYTGEPAQNVRLNRFIRDAITSGRYFWDGNGHTLVPVTPQGVVDVAQTARIALQQQIPQIGVSERQNIPDANLAEIATAFTVGQDMEFVLSNTQGALSLADIVPPELRSTYEFTISHTTAGGIAQQGVVVWRGNRWMWAQAGNATARPLLSAGTPVRISLIRPTTVPTSRVERQPDPISLRESMLPETYDRIMTTLDLAATDTRYPNQTIERLKALFIASHVTPEEVYELQGLIGTPESRKKLRYNEDVQARLETYLRIDRRTESIPLLLKGANFPRGVPRQWGMLVGYDRAQHTAINRPIRSGKELVPPTDSGTVEFAMVAPHLASVFPSSLAHFPAQHPQYAAKHTIRPDETCIIVMKNGKDRMLAYYQNGELVLATNVSFGAGVSTPKGDYSVTDDRAKFRRSHKYKNAPMPYAVNVDIGGGYFFHQGEVGANNFSHGCVRVPGLYAKQLYAIADPGTRVIIDDLS